MMERSPQSNPRATRARAAERRRGFLHTWRRLSWRQRGFASSGPLLLLLADIALRTRGYERNRRLVARLPRLLAFPPRNPVAALRSRCFVLRAVANRMPFRSDCLRQCLVLLTVARRWGVEATIRFGVDQGAEDFVGHAWLEVDGAPVWPEDPVLGRTRPLATSERPASAR